MRFKICSTSTCTVKLVKGETEVREEYASDVDVVLEMPTDNLPDDIKL